ncbi:MAG: tocopherol cyclase family protein [Thermoplasmatota archaeon]
MGKLRRLLNPPVFQGTLKEKAYFEGWYLKNVSSDLSSVISFIPGISLSKKSHSFVQVIDGVSGWTEYFEFPAEDFRPEKDRFEVSVGSNRFSSNGLEVDLKGEGHRILGRLDFKAPAPFPRRLLSPGIMGWYTFVPGMECYHGVVSMGHGLEGNLSVDGEVKVFDGGKGYIEKDWGRSFPETWIWLQCNNFDDEDISLMFSVAKIPWLGRHFTGFLSFLKTGEEVYRFATYTGARVTGFSSEGERMSLEVKDRKHRLSIEATQRNTGELAAPLQGSMDRRIKESVDSDVKIELRDMKGNVKVASLGRRAGLEIMGDIRKLSLPRLPRRQETRNP